MLEEMAVSYLLQALQAWVSQHPGRLSSMATSGQDAVPELKRLAISRLPGLAPAWQALLRSRLLQYDQNREALLDTCLERLQAEPGEVGRVARRYPAWVADHLRRLFNLAVAWARGENVGLDAREARRGLER